MDTSCVWPQVCTTIVACFWAAAVSAAACRPSKRSKPFRQKRCVCYVCVCLLFGRTCSGWSLDQFRCFPLTQKNITQRYSECFQKWFPICGIDYPNSSRAFDSGLGVNIALKAFKDTYIPTRSMQMQVRELQVNCFRARSMTTQQLWPALVAASSLLPRCARFRTAVEWG